MTSFTSISSAVLNKLYCLWPGADKMAEKVAVVTGANKGLGFSVVRGLCRNFKGIVYLTARNKERGLEAVKKLQEEGLFPEFHLLDISDIDSVKQFSTYLKSKHRGFDVLVNNAAILEWNEVYPSYETAKRNVEVNYKSLLTIEEHLYPLLREGARVVNVSSACGLLSNLKNQKWIEVLSDNNLKTEQINDFVAEYLKSVKDGTFDKNNFADDGKHAEYRVSKIAFTALTMVQQRKYMDRKISINAVYPGHIKTDMAAGGGKISPDEAAGVIIYLIIEASPNLKGVFMWNNKKLFDWLDTESNFHCQDLW